MGQRTTSSTRGVSPRTYGRNPSLLDPIAPDWVVRIIAPKKTDVPWGDMVRAGLTVPGVLAVSLLVGQPGLGVFAGMGGMIMGLIDPNAELPMFQERILPLMVEAGIRH